MSAWFVVCPRESLNKAIYANQAKSIFKLQKLLLPIEGEKGEGREYLNRSRGDNSVAMNESENSYTHRHKYIYTLTRIIC